MFSKVSSVFMPKNGIDGVTFGEHINEHAMKHVIGEGIQLFIPRRLSQ